MRNKNDSLEDERFIVDIRKNREGTYDIGTKLLNGFNTIVNPDDYYVAGLYGDKMLYERKRSS